MIELIEKLAFWDWLQEPIPGVVLFLLTMLVTSIMVTRRSLSQWWSTPVQEGS